MVFVAEMEACVASTSWLEARSSKKKSFVRHGRDFPFHSRRKKADRTECQQLEVNNLEVNHRNASFSLMDL
jgi:hypothetical protein